MSWRRQLLCCQFSNLFSGRLPETETGNLCPTVRGPLSSACTVAGAEWHFHIPSPAKPVSAAKT
jgi:hypothetical protein